MLNLCNRKTKIVQNKNSATHPKLKMEPDHKSESKRRFRSFWSFRTFSGSITLPTQTIHTFASTSIPTQKKTGKIISWRPWISESLYIHLLFSVGFINPSPNSFINPSPKSFIHATSSKSFTTSVCPFKAARRKGVKPCGLDLSLSALCSNKILKTSICPCSAARCKGVVPVISWIGSKAAPRWKGWHSYPETHTSPAEFFASEIRHQLMIGRYPEIYRGFKKHPRWLYHRISEASTGKLSYRV